MPRFATVLTRLMRLPYLLLAVLAVVRCADGEPALLEPHSTDVTVQREYCYDPVDPHCINEPPPGDPDPMDEGEYLGLQYGTNCFGSLYNNDVDGDQLDDACEVALARAFRPLMHFSQGETWQARESYWRVTMRPGLVVRIYYLLGYHYDPGAKCFWDFKLVCMSHWGDSEFVVLEVYFDDDTSHWKVLRGYLSAHWNNDNSQSRWYGHASLRYDDEQRGAPVVYVAYRKHANYATAEICTETTDSCPGPGFREPFLVQSERNVGEPGASMVTEPVRISNPSYYGTEYFWSDVRFCGWHQAAIDGGRANCAASYYKALTYALMDQE